MSVPPLRNGWSAVTVSVLLHGVIALLAVAAYLFVRKPPPSEVRLAIDATVITAAPRQASRPAPPAPAVTPPPVEEPVVEPEEDPEEKAAEQRAAEKKAEEKREAEQLAARERAADAKREADEKRVADEKAAQLKAAQEKAARDKAAAEKLAKDKADKEKAAQDKLAREKALAEQQRVQREADLNAQIAAEERAAAARSSGQMSQYIAQITAKIERNWIRPASAQPGLSCEVRVSQAPGGTVITVQVARCNGDESVRQSIERAVYKASPLPMPSDPALFERNLVVTFRPES